MKSFEALTSEQQWAAVDHAFNESVEGIYEGMVEISVSNPHVQRKLDILLKRARGANSKRLFQLQVLHNKPIRMEISRVAMAAAAGSKYHSNGKPIKVTKDEIDKHLNE